MQEMDDDEVFFMEMEPNPITITFSNSSQRHSYFEGPTSSRPYHSPLLSISSTADSGISMMRHRSSHSFSDSDAGSTVRTRASSTSSYSATESLTAPDPLNTIPAAVPTDRSCQQRRRASWPSSNPLHCLQDELANDCDQEGHRRTDIGTQTSVESILEGQDPTEDYDDVFPAASPLPGPMAASGPLPDIVQPWERTGAIPRRRVVSYPEARPRTPERGNGIAGLLRRMADEMDHGLNLQNPQNPQQQQQGRGRHQAVAVQVRTDTINFSLLLTPMGMGIAQWLLQWVLAKLFRRQP